MNKYEGIDKLQIKRVSKITRLRRELEKSSNELLLKLKSEEHTEVDKYSQGRDHGVYAAFVAVIKWIESDAGNLQGVNLY